MAAAQGLVFGMLGKSLDDGNFVEAWQGCDDEAKLYGDRCVHLGSNGPAHPRLQKQAIEEALKSRQFQALAISVTSSKFIATALQSASIPIFTFDSPFALPELQYSRAYIGTDNLAFGRSLARIARQLRPGGGSLCIITAAHDPNLAERVYGVRRELSGNSQLPPGRPLAGQGGWVEHRRCPWNAADSIEQTMTGLTLMLYELRPDVMISVGHWPVLDPAQYRKMVSPFRPQFASLQRIMIVGVGKLTPQQTALQQDKLVHGYVSIDFARMGRQSYQVMKAALEGRPYPPVSYTPNLLLPAP